MTSLSSLLIIAQENGKVKMIRCNLQKSKDSGLYYLLSQLKIHHFKALKWYGPSVEITDLTKPKQKSRVIGPCAHFSSMDHKKNIGGNLMPNILEDLYYENISPSERWTRAENRKIYRTPPLRYDEIAKEEF